MIKAAELFLSDFIILHRYQHCQKASVAPYSCQYLVLSVSFILEVPIVIHWFLIVALVCISLMANDVAFHVLMCHLW